MIAVLDVASELAATTSVIHRESHYEKRFNSTDYHSYVGIRSTENIFGNSESMPQLGIKRVYRRASVVLWAEYNTAGRSWAQW